MKGANLVIGGDDSSFRREQGEDRSPSVLSATEICMLEKVKHEDRFSVTCTEQEVRAIGSRSRQPVITKILDLSLLDDTYAGVTKILLSRCNTWSFNTFNLDVSTGGRSLSYLLVHLFQEYGFVNHFRLDIVKVWHCFNLMEAAYHRHNPYHNSVHAADVTQAMHCFLQENKFSAHLTPLEAMSSVIAAVAHDLDHPGVTQAFLVATSNHLVNLYHNSSVLENHHWRTAISCLSESGIFSHLEKEIWQDIQKHIRSLILATDITRQKEFLGRFKSYLSSNSLNMEDSQYRHFALQIALKCADLCNPCRPWTISQRWSYQVCQEFYRQGAYERQLKLPLTPTFDCSRTKVAKIQADFFQFVVSPLFETWDHFLKTPLSNMLLENLKHNFNQWQLRITQQQKNENDNANEAPEIKIESPPLEENSSLETCETESKHLLSTDSDIIIKQRRSKSDSGLSPCLLSPKIHMETYSTEELHPSTTLLSLSSITNTVQLRQVYATTKVESHLICPTVFQPLTDKTTTKEPTKNIECSLPVQDCDEDCCSSSVSDNSINFNNAQSCNDSLCPDGCGTPSTPENSPPLITKSKQRSQSLVHDSEHIKRFCQVLQNRRASDFDSVQICRKLHTPLDSISITSNSDIKKDIPHDYANQMPFFTSDNTANNNRYSSTTEVSSFTSSKMCSNKQCFSATCICEMESDKKIPSWCWHISRSFSAERPVRPTHDFDSPLPSGHGSVTSLNYKSISGRRGSAPVTITLNEANASHSLCSKDRETKGGLRGGSETNGASGRRWSIPVEISGFQAIHSSGNISDTNSSATINTRSSFGLLEPLLSVSTLDRESPLKQGCSPSLKPIHPTYTFSNHKQKSKNELNEYRTEKTITSSDSFLPFLLSPRSSSGQRRGSLPTDLYHCGEKLPLLAGSSQFNNQPNYLLEHTRKQSSPSDLLSVLIGPSGMLNTMHGLVTGPTICQLQCLGKQECSRRRSGGLEMLSGLWKSRTNDAGIGLGMSNKLILRKKLLEAWSSWRSGESDISPTVETNAEKSAFSDQQRRGSVPLTISLLSLSSGSPNDC